MIRFIAQTLIMLCLSVILYLMAKALPRISDEPDNGPANRSRIMVYIEKLDEILKALLEKTLRQFRVWLLRLDNFIGQKLNRFKKETPKETKLPAVEEKKENTED
jgi:hypothetical protein